MKLKEYQFFGVILNWNKNESDTDETFNRWAIWCAVLENINNFLSTKYFFVQHHLVLSTRNTFFVQHQHFFGWYETLLRTTSNFFFRHKISFCATPNFCFGHSCIAHWQYIFFVVVFETKKLVIHLLLTCLIHESSYSEMLWEKGVLIIDRL